MNKALIVFIYIFFFPLLVYAEAGDFLFSGYIDGSYNYLVKSNKFTSSTFDRVYDIQENGFTLHQLAVTLAKQPPQALVA